MTRLRPLSRLQMSLVMPRLTRPDGWLLVAVAGLVGLGIVMVFNVSYFHAQERFGDSLMFFRKHLIAVAVGTIAMFGASRLRPELFERWANLALPATLLLLLLVLLPGVGVERGGARRWLPIGSFSLQPAEFAKLAVVLFLARWISRRRDVMERFRVSVLPLLPVIGLCGALILCQPDYGTGAILCGLLLLMLFVGGARPTHLAAVALAAGSILGVGAVVAEYRMRRLVAFLDPWGHSQDSGFQLVQSLIAFGSGGLSGVGLGDGRQKMFFLPEGHTDFIFALIGEELGLVGAAVVLVLFAIIAFRGLRVAARHPDHFASLLAFGLTLVIVLTAVVNVGVVLGLLPTTGLPLPFVSYGGSALVTAMLEVGMITALSRMTG